MRRPTHTHGVIARRRGPIARHGDGQSCDTVKIHPWQSDLPTSSSSSWWTMIDDRLPWRQCPIKYNHPGERKSTSRHWLSHRHFRPRYFRLPYLQKRIQCSHEQYYTINSIVAGPSPVDTLIVRSWQVPLCVNKKLCTHGAQPRCCVVISSSSSPSLACPTVASPPPPPNRACVRAWWFVGVVVFDHPIHPRL